MALALVPMLRTTWCCVTTASLFKVKTTKKAG
jgi:hypothetical protein